MTPQESEKLKEKENNRCIIAHEIAKELCEKTQTYWEALYIVDKVTDMIEYSMDREKPRVLPYPIDRYRQRVELPGTETPDGRQ